MARTVAHRSVPRTVALLVAAAPLLAPRGAAAEDTIPLPDLDAGLAETLRVCLDEHGRSPVDYVAGLFDDHDVVFVGETHCIRYTGRLVQELVPALYAAGVRRLGVEFGRREDQALIDSLLALPEYDPAVANEIIFRQFLHHPFQEYADVFRAAWAVNRDLPPGAPGFRVLGINDSPDWSWVKTREDRDDEEIKRKVWRGQGEDLWARCVLDEVERGEKVLVYAGIHHAFTGYAMPVVDGRTGEFIRYYRERAGNHVFAAIGRRAATVFLHAPWTSIRFEEELYPAGGVIDTLMRALGPDAYPVGFDVRGTPFGDLPVSGYALYAAGYEDLTLGDWCDGWVFVKPISEFEGMTPIPGFINEDNVERARAITWNPDFREALPGAFAWQAAQLANVKWKYRRFK